jgi:hypothetical protein
MEPQMLKSCSGKEVREWMKVIPERKTKLIE